MQPRLVKEVRDTKGRTIERFEPRMVRQVVSPEVTRKIAEVLVKVVLSFLRKNESIMELPRHIGQNAVERFSERIRP